MNYAAIGGQYFMSPEDQDAVVGRLMREYKDAENTLATLHAEAERLGREFVQLGQALSTQPEGIQLEGKELEMNFRGKPCWVKKSAFDVDKIIALANQYRSTMHDIERLSNNLRQLGFDEFKRFH